MRDPFREDPCYSIKYITFTQEECEEMDEEGWKPLLKHLFEQEKLVIAASLNPNDENVERIANEMDWDPMKTAEKLRFLEQTGLIEKQTENYRIIDVPDRYKSPGPYQISQKGFDVARELESRSRKRGHNQFIGLLTMSLAISSIAASIPENFSLYRATNIGLLLTQVGIFILVVYLLRKEQLLDI